MLQVVFNRPTKIMLRNQIYDNILRVFIHSPLQSLNVR